MSEELLTSQEKDVLGEISNISMGSAATALSGLLGKRVEITVPRVEVVSSQDMDAFFPGRTYYGKGALCRGFARK